MNKPITFSALILFVLFIPSISNAQFSNNHNNWFESPAITPTAPPDIIFPVQGSVTFSDDFGDGRSGGRLHEGNDLMAPKMTPILAARGGRVSFAPTTEPSYGYMLSI